MRSVLLLSLLASAALAQGGPSQGNGGRISRGNLLPIPQYRTPGTGAQSYFVDGSLGADTNACTASGASACATVQGALNKVPKLLRDQVTITVANGNYACFRISGFTYDTSQQTTNGGLYITGNLATATVATGTASGTSTAGSVGSGATFGTLTDSGQTWTVNDLRGKLVTIGGTVFTISSNTATAITTVGTCSTCAASVAYTIQVPGWNVNTACTAPATPIQAAAANNCQICASDNIVNYRLSASAVTIENVGLIAASGAGFTISDSSSYTLRQFMKNTGTGSLVQGNNVSAPNLALTNGSYTGSTTGYVFAGRLNGLLTLSSVLSFGSNGGLTNIGTVFADWPSLSITGAEANNATTGGIVMMGGRANIQSSRFDCASSSGSGIVVGNNAATAGLALQTMPAASISIQQSSLGSTCGNALLAYGPVWVNANTSTIAGATYGVNASWGAEFIDMTTSGGNTVTGGTAAITLDNGNVTAAQGDVSATSCLATATFNSRYCKP